MISSGCSLAIAARTTCSTSLASRTLEVSTILNQAPVGRSSANADGPVDADARVDNKPRRAADAPLRRLIANWFMTSHFIRLAPGPGAILRSRIDNDFSFGSLVRTAFTARPDA